MESVRRAGLLTTFAYRYWSIPIQFSSLIPIA